MPEGSGGGDMQKCPAGQEEIRISNRATYWPVAPIDLVVGAPLVARLLLRASPVGRVVQVVALGAYLGNAVRDWRERRGIRPIDFRREFGADMRRLAPMPREVRGAEVRRLAERLNDDFTGQRIRRRELAGEVDRHLTRYIAGITGQRVRTSAEVRSFTLVGLALPFALGMCDILSSDVAIFKDAGFFEPLVIAHEFSHRKGYWKELHAQALAYLSLMASGDPVLRQSARLERLHADLRVLSGDDSAAFNSLVARAGLRPELERSLLERRPSGAVMGSLEAALRRLYDARMRLTGQNGISDYDLGFTNFLHTFATSVTARQRPPLI
jgi:Protein of unknown function (DUF3810)